MRTVSSFCLLLTLAAHGEDYSFFESKIRPVLVKHCYECHSNESGKSKGGLLLDTKAAIRAGGDTGPAVVPSSPKDSLLLKAIRHADPDLEMPPNKAKLPDAVIADFERWIQAGAADPRESSTATSERPPVDIAGGRQFWCYKRPVKHPHAKGGIDAFIHDKLKEHKLEAAPEADAAVILRRLHFDLLGLPPTPEQAAAFSLDRLEQTVDDLLSSPRFGERWARHWLDVVRYAESNGRESNLTFPHAWRYRDYVIDAFNADIPFDRFLIEQLAGDLLPAKTDAERARLLIATGFLAMGPKGLNEQNKAQFAADLADEQLDTVTRAFMASSVACARCHDHKTEPFSMEDYYGLAGIFKSTQTFYGNWIDSENNNHGHLIRLPDLPGQTIVGKSLPPARVKQLQTDLAKLNAEDKEMNDYIAKAKAENRDISGEFNKLLGNALRIIWSRGGVEGALEAVDEKGRALPLCMGAKDGKIHDSALYERGEIAHLAGHLSIDRFRGEDWMAAAAYNVLWTVRGIPCLYYGEEIAFMRGAPQDVVGANDTLDQTGRAYFGDHISDARIGQTQSHPLYRHIKRLNQIRRAVPALQKGRTDRFSEWGSGISFARDWNDAESYVVVGLAIGSDQTVTVGNIRNGRYVDAVTGGIIDVGDGSISFGVRPVSAGIWVLNGPGKIGEDGEWLR